MTCELFESDCATLRASDAATIEYSDAFPGMYNSNGQLKVNVNLAS